MKKLLFVFLTALCLTFNAVAAVNINTASQAELQTLQGIGPTKAKAIVDYRKKHGKFKSIQDLEAVKGIGQKTVKSLRKKVTLTGKTSVSKKKASKKSKTD